MNRAATAVLLLVLVLPGAVLAADDEIRFFRYPLTGASSLEELIAEIGAEDFVTILKLNRIDPNYARQGDTLIVPRPIPTLPELSPFPQVLPGMHSIPKLLVVSLRVQAWGAYDFGLLARWGPASTGKRSTPTCEGFYHTNWKSQQRASTVNSDWILKWSFNFDNLGGCSIHLYDLPGRPASHSCVRALEEDAAWIYGWADQWILTPDGNVILRNGTPLVIFGAYDFDSPPPWKSLPEDPGAVLVPLAEVEAALDSIATPHGLASLSPEGLEIEVQIDSTDSRFDLLDLGRRLSASGEIKLVRYHFMTDKLSLLAPMDKRFDFDSLRVALQNGGVSAGEINIEGLGRAQRVGGMASMVARNGGVLFLLESMNVPGMGYLQPVEFRFRGLVSVRSEVDDPRTPFRLILRRVERTRPEEFGGYPEGSPLADPAPADSTAAVD
jgi:hypothetical protein